MGWPCFSACTIPNTNRNGVQQIIAQHHLREDYTGRLHWIPLLHLRFPGLSGSLDLLHTLVLQFGQSSTWNLGRDGCAPTKLRRLQPAPTDPPFRLPLFHLNPLKPDSQSSERPQIYERAKKGRFDE